MDLEPFFFLLGLIGNEEIKMKVSWYILIIALSFSCSNHRGEDRNIETPTSPGTKTHLSTRPESIGLYRKKRNKLIIKTLVESVGNKNSDGKGHSNQCQ